MPPNTSQIRLIANQSFGCYPFSKTLSDATWRFPLWTSRRRSFRAVWHERHKFHGESMWILEHPWWKPTETGRMVERNLDKKNKGVYYPLLSRNVHDLLTGIYHLCVLAYSREFDEELLRMLANTLDSSVWNTYFLPEAWTCNQPTLCGKYPKNGSPIPSFAVKRTIHLQPWDLWLGLPHYQCPHF